MGLTGGSMVKNPPAKGDVGLIPRLGRSVGDGNGNPLQYSCWKIPWTEKPGGLQFMGQKRELDMTQQLNNNNIEPNKKNNRQSIKIY